MISWFFIILFFREIVAIRVEYVIISYSDSRPRTVGQGFKTIKAYAIFFFNLCFRPKWDFHVCFAVLPKVNNDLILNTI